jgi:hypothetical protein
MRVLLIALFASAFTSGAVSAAPPVNERLVQDTAGFYKAVNSAKPGDRILLAPGDYKGNFHFQNIHGTAESPIVIGASDPKRPPRLSGEKACLQFTAVSYLELSDLVLGGSKDNGLNIDDGEKQEKPSHHITLRNLSVSDVGPKGNVDGMKLSGIDDLLVVGCKVERWGSDGSGIDMVGCHRAVITNCEIRNGGDNGIQVKGGSVSVLISRCWFENSGERAINLGGLTGPGNFRPALNTFPEDARYEVKDSRIEGCTFVGGKAAVAVIGADGAIVRYNTIFRPENYALRILQENDTKGFVPCRYGVFENNLVVFQSEKWGDGGVNIGPGTAPKTFRFARNLWYCEDRPDRSAPKLPVVEKDGITGKDPLFRDVAKKDFGVKAESPAIARGAHALPEEKK